MVVSTLDDETLAYLCWLVSARMISSEVHTSRGRFCVKSHKWLCAPKGAGFLYARPERQSVLKPLVVSWGWDARDPGPSPFHDLFDWIGTDDPSAYLSVPAAIAFQGEHDWQRVRAACHALAREARERIGAIFGLPQIAPDSPDWWGQMCAVPLPLREDVAREDLRAGSSMSSKSRSPSPTGTIGASCASPYRRTTR